MMDSTYNEHTLANDITEHYGRRSDQEKVILELIRQRNQYMLQLHAINTERERWRDHARDAEQQMYKAIASVREILNLGH